MPPSLAGSDVELPGDIDVGSDEVSLPPSLAGSDMELPGDIDGDSNLSAPELPPAVSSPGFDGQSEASSSNIDLPMDIEFSDVEDGRLESVPAGRVPSPSEAKHLTGSHLLAEFYSVPRVSRALDLACLLAFDIHTGWDFAQESMRQLSIWLLHTLSIHLLMLSPPCTAFSQLQIMWNYPRMDTARANQIWDRDMELLEHSMRCACVQGSTGRAWCFEHPERAESWKTKTVADVRALPGALEVVFDQCMVGLQTPISRIPMRKRTRLLTNSPLIVAAFSGRLCNRSHHHRIIHGSEGGIKLAKWAQTYPDDMVQILADCARKIAP